MKIERNSKPSKPVAPWWQAFYIVAAGQEEKRVEKQGYAFILLGISATVFSLIFPKLSTADFAMGIGIISDLIGLQRLYKSEQLKHQKLAAARAAKKILDKD